jgi:peroxiredoxin
MLLLAGGIEAGRAVNHRPDPKRPPAFAVPPEPPPVEVQVGDPAPNFSYQGFDGRWMRLHHLLDQGPVLLVIAPGQEELRRLEQERESLLDLGVIPVAIVDLRSGAARSLAQRLGLRYTVISDQRRVIASLFNVVHDGRVAPSWFVIDRQGKVRGLLRGRIPAFDYPQLCARVLALPLPGATLPSLGGHGPTRRAGR